MSGAGVYSNVPQFEFFVVARRDGGGYATASHLRAPHEKELRFMQSSAAGGRWRAALLHGGLFVATFVTMTALFSMGQSAEPFTAPALLDAMFFSVPALLILASHELGHYFMARAWGVDSSLPYFIPFPLGFGTLGAVIRLKGKIPSRNALFDIGYVEVNWNLGCPFRMVVKKGHMRR